MCISIFILFIKSHKYIVSFQGDSGGPLVRMNEQKPLALGVASFVSRRGCAKKYIPAVYTYIPSYLDWITENAEEEASNICIRDKDETS